MFEVIAGEGPVGASVFEAVWDVVSAPGHVSVVSAWAVDTETYAEPDLSDAELLGLAAEEAGEAAGAGLVIGAGAVDAVSVRRLRRRLSSVSSVRGVEGAVV